MLLIDVEILMTLNTINDPKNCLHYEKKILLSPFFFLSIYGLISAQQMRQITGRVGKEMVRLSLASPLH
jgi:hypothetical protein